MTSNRPGPLAGIAVALAGFLFASPLSAQEFSPYTPRTGQGAYDQYNDAVWCGAVLERESEAAPDAERRSQIDRGLNYARNFALFMLDSRDVVDPAGRILAADHLPAAWEKARAGWQAVLDTLAEKGETPEAEIARCLRIYGHDWD